MLHFRGQAYLAPFRGHYSLIFVGAAGYFLGHPNPFISMPLLTLLTPAALFILSYKEKEARSVFLSAWLMGMLGLSGAVYWIYYPVHDVGGLPALLTLPCIALLGTFLGLYTALTGLAMRTLHAIGASSSQKLFASALGGGIVFAGFEVLCGFLFTGFPWYNLASAFAVWPAWVQTASLIGSYGLTALYASSACLLAVCFISRNVFGIFAALAGCAFFAGSVWFGAERLANVPEPTGTPATVALIQGNIDQNQKWDAAFLQSTVDTYKNLTLDKVKEYNTSHPEAPVNLIVWPETAMPFILSQLPEYSDQVRQIAIDSGAYLALGTLGYKPSPPPRSMRIYNRLHLLAPNGTDAGFYDKQHLVPFGEYIPFSLSLPFLENILQGVDFSQGSKGSPLAVYIPQQLEATAAQKALALGILICYEVIFPELAEDRVSQGATVLLTVSNDAWFGDSAAPWQHLGLAAMRAVEQQRPLIRATNTGVTAVSDPYGRLTIFGSLYTDGAFTASVYPETAFTFYHLYGTKLPNILLGAALCALLFHPVRTLWRRRKSHI